MPPLMVVPPRICTSLLAVVKVWVALKLPKGVVAQRINRRRLPAVGMIRVKRLAGELEIGN